MSVIFSVEVRNARLDAVETAIGATPRLRIYTGPRNTLTTDAEIGTLLVDMPLLADFLSAASGGSKALNGTWSVVATGNGVAGHYRILNNALSLTHEMGSVGQGSGDLSLDNTTIAAGQTVAITTFTKTDGNNV